MASPSSPQHEPTMEEILASIRKIISEDSTDAQAPTVHTSAAQTSRQDGDVLELTPAQEVREEPRPVVSAPQPAAVVQSTPTPAAPEPAVVTDNPPPAVAELHPVENDVVFVSREEPTVSSPARSESDDGIFSDKARKVLDDAFANLDQVEQPRREAARPTIAAMPGATDGHSVEAVFERAVHSAVEPLLSQWMESRKDDLLGAVKPMVREWMDEHFPAILEGAVRDEVARVVKARGR